MRRILRTALALSAAALLGACSPAAGAPTYDPPNADAGSPCEPGPPLAVQLGTARDDEALAVVAGEDGLYVAGYEDGTLGSSVEPGGAARGFVIHLAPDARVVERWSLDAERATIEALLPDGAGPPLFAGRAVGAIGSGPAGGSFDAVVGRLRPGGGLGDVTRFGAETPQHPRVLARLGDALVVGGQDDVHVPTNYVDRWEDPFFAVLAPARPPALFAWDTAASDAFGGLATSAETAIYVAWYGGGAAGGVHVAKHSADGARVWSTRLSSVGFDGVGAVRVAPSGEVVVAGSTFLTLGERSFGQQDAFVAFLDPDTGEPERFFQFGSDQSEWVTDMVISPDGRVHVVGDTLGAVSPENANQGDYDVFAVTFDANGQVERAFQRGTEGDDHAAAAAIDACGRLYVAGYSMRGLAGPSHGGRDGFVLEVR